MTVTQALAFVKRHGIVLESAQHAAIPSLAEAIAGQPLRGSWWSHPKRQAIFATTRAVRASAQVLVCRLVDGRITLVHARLWPALARLAERFPAARLSRVTEVHSASGAHQLDETRFPQWLGAATAAAAKRLTEAEACAALGALLPVLTGKP